MALKAVPKMIRQIVTDHQTEHEIIRFQRNSQEHIPAYIQGVAQPRERTRTTIKGHHQPIGKGKLLSSLPEGQRLEDVKKWWTLDETKAKDKIIIDGFIYTVNAVMKWASYEDTFTEADLLRTGEADNID